MGDDAALTELAGVAELQTEASYAWALDYDDYDERARRFTPRRITEAALAASLVLIAAAGGVALLSIRGVWHIDLDEPAVAAPTVSATVSATALPPSTTPAARPPVAGPWITPTKPVTVTVQAPPKTVDAPPPAGITVEQVAAYDQQFVANLRARGWNVWDSLAITQQAHQVCAALERGVSPQVVGQQLVGPTTPPGDAAQFVTTAMLTYPACP